MSNDRLQLADGETAFLKAEGKFVKGGNPEASDPLYAEAGSVLVGRNVAGLKAGNTSCRVVALINEQMIKLGAFIHINVSDMDVPERNQEGLTQATVACFPDIVNSDTLAVISGKYEEHDANDPLSTEESVQRGNEMMQSWQQEIREYLASIGITKIIDVTPILSSDDAINNELDMITAILRITNQAGQVLYTNATEE